MFNRQNVKFNTLAKLTNANYGSINAPASLDTLKKAIMVATIASHKTMISANAQPS